MINKRFNRKFRRALGAALGALSVASISNVDVVTEAYTETDIYANNLINWIYEMPRANRALIWYQTNRCWEAQDFKSLKNGIRNCGDFVYFGAGWKVSYPYYLGKCGEWKGFNVTITCQGHPDSRIAVLQASSPGRGFNYLLTPPLSQTDFNNYAKSHYLPAPYSWTVPGPMRVDGGHVFCQPDPHAPDYVAPVAGDFIRYQTSQANMIHGDVIEQQNHRINIPVCAVNRNLLVSKENFLPKYRKYFQDRWPGGARPPVAAEDPMFKGDSEYLTLWHNDLLTDASIWDKGLTRIGGPAYLAHPIDKVPAELYDRYFPPKPDVPTEKPTVIFSNSNSTPVSLDSNASTMNTATTAAVGLCTAAAIAPTLSDSVSTASTNVSSTQTPVDSYATTNASTNAQTTNLTQETNFNHNHAALEKNQIQSNVGGNQETTKS